MRRDDIVLLDGALGTCLWEKAADRVPVWRYNLENPTIVTELCHEYVDAGSQIIYTNTFGANRLTVSKTDYSVGDVVSTGVRLTREAVAGRAKVALSIGPLTELMEPYGDLTEEECAEIFDEQISAGMQENPDLLVLETFLDAEMMRVAVETGAKYGKPIFASLTFTEVGKTIMGQSVQDFVETMQDLPVSAIGLNCSLGPDKAVPVIASFRQYTDLPLIFKPNAGMPMVDEHGNPKKEFDIQTFVNDVMPALEHDVTYVGGCCGSSPDYIRALRKAIYGA